MSAQVALVKLCFYSKWCRDKHKRKISRHGKRIIYVCKFDGKCSQCAEVSAQELGKVGYDEIKRRWMRGEL